jgi:hypothetical protein
MVGLDLRYILILVTHWRYTYIHTHKRYTKRSIFLQILLFSMSDIDTMIFDKKQEHMLFVTGNVYCETGTNSFYRLKIHNIRWR